MKFLAIFKLRKISQTTTALQWPRYANATGARLLGSVDITHGSNLGLKPGAPSTPKDRIDKILQDLQAELTNWFGL